MNEVQLAHCHGHKTVVVCVFDCEFFNNSHWGQVYVEGLNIEVSSSNNSLKSVMLVLVMPKVVVKPG